MSSITPWNEAPSVLSVFNRGGGGSAHLYRYMKYQCACITKSLAVASFVNVIKSYQYQANQFHNMCWINLKADTIVDVFGDSMCTGNWKRSAIRLIFYSCICLFVRIQLMVVAVMWGNLNEYQCQINYEVANGYPSCSQQWSVESTGKGWKMRRKHETCPLLSYQGSIT